MSHSDDLPARGESDSLTDPGGCEGEERAAFEFGNNMLDVAPTFFVAIGRDGKTLMMNRAMLAALGYEREEVIGRDYMTTFVPERDRALLGRVFATLMRDREPSVNENRVLTRDGRELLVEWHGKPHYSDSGAFEYFFGVGVQTGERRDVEAALRRSEQKLALHMQQTPLGAIEWDLDFKVIEWNPAAERIFGFTRDEAMGRHAAGLIVPESARAQVDRLWRDLVKQVGGTRSRNENNTKDGRILIGEWYNTPLVDEDGRTIGVASLVNDVTEQQALEDALRRRERAQGETIQRLSAPVIEIGEGVLTLPILGDIDGPRAAFMTESLLAAIVRTRAAYVLVDLTGMDAVDATSAGHLVNMVRAARLLGSHCLISGICASTAQTMIGLDLGLSDFNTFGTLRDALAFALRRTEAKGRG
jgi:PAS domain S-box-containing protein